MFLAAWSDRHFRGTTLRGNLADREARRLLEKMKKALSMLCGHPQCGEEIVHADSEVFVMVIERGGMVRFGR